MAKQRTFLTKLVQKVKRDAGSAWTRDVIGSFDRMAGDQGKPVPGYARTLHGEGFVGSLQQEALVRMFDEGMRVTDPEDSSPFIFPGLMAAWESLPVSMEMDVDAISHASGDSFDIGAVPLDGLHRLFRDACLSNRAAAAFVI